MIDETFRPISSRESGQQYQQYVNSRRAEIAQLKKDIMYRLFVNKKRKSLVKNTRKKPKSKSRRK